MTVFYPFFLFCFGLGFSARECAIRSWAKGWRVAGTGRKPASGPPHRLAFERGMPLASGTLRRVSHLLIAIPPDAQGDPVLAEHARDIAAARPSWIGYLSSTGLYGNHNGARVDEDTEPRPEHPRSFWRLSAEREWLAFGARHELPVHIFRLAGIYGPGRSALDRIRAGNARRIHVPGQLFGHIHVTDIANALEASMARPHPGRIYNVADDEPSPPGEPLLYAARLLGQPTPPLVPLERANLSPMAASFYTGNRRICNRRLRTELEVSLAYPHYRAGLEAIYRQEINARCG